MTAFKASTCCRSGESTECACGTFYPILSTLTALDCVTNSHTAQQATCSCGQKPALHCNCDKAATENLIQGGARCSCRARPAGECTCQRSATENVRPSGATCACGVRAADACTCEKASDGGFNPANEVDFTTRK